MSADIDNDEAQKRATQVLLGFALLAAVVLLALIRAEVLTQSPLWYGIAGLVFVICAVVCNRDLYHGEDKSETLGLRVLFGVAATLLIGQAAFLLF